jgi:hypothetical protein
VDPVVLNVPNTAVIPDSAVLTHGSVTVTAGAGAATAGAAAGGAAAGAVGEPPAHPAMASAATHAADTSSPR